MQNVSASSFDAEFGSTFAVTLVTDLGSYVTVARTVKFNVSLQ